MFEKILIANRGEIACRVIRTCRRLGIASVAVYSEADAAALHVRLADEAYCIGGPAPADSYLRGDAVIQAALDSGAQAIHPGYGFLSENAAFAEAVAAAGLVFIGPGAGSMRRMGSKAGAKQLMAQAGVPVVPGYNGEDQALATLSREAARTGFPLMVKAAHGGGGKGMRVVHRLEDFVPALESCQREALGAFGRDRVLLERYVSSPRHIEIQVFGDTHGNVIHLNERECSAQRRYQKVLEESPSPFLTPQLRQAMGEAAVLAARAIDYVNAGTVEFIVDPDGAFYFMEINTRLQVEHPVTEMVTGLDLVEWQLRVAAGEPLPLAQAQVPQQGHAIEVRLYAEDPESGFLPASGTLRALQLPPPSAHVRIDAGVEAGDTVTVFYDPMIAKLIVHDADRAHALARLRGALAQCHVAGTKTNLGFLEALARHPAVVEARIDTGYLDRHLDEFTKPGEPPARSLLAAAATAFLLRQQAEERRRAAAAEPHSPWARADGWRLHGRAPRRLRLQAGGQVHALLATGQDGDWTLEVDGSRFAISGARLADGVMDLRIDGQGRRVPAFFDGDTVELHDGRRRLPVHWLPAERGEGGDESSGDGRVLAPMPGRVVLVKATAGQAVAAGAELLVMEAMKMELTVRAPREGIVAELRAVAGDFVEADTVLARVAAE
ncbi:acetyl/propionyl/methylcrotonyl-CoA carboxylase subunit alpha [Pseudoxanthomonas kaohsiungensis]|uniref:Biotin carboxylase N-terminal domain-containing protein n=1 Tax=Pseudoxanthomonas kaohsiungensis TaxID=283923 RepID=A0ABW3LX34_9GAMM|nr:acetyl/propionyl/methylcrotonyl-CoA carboxylase subunit alpha [Pseudoxanthomonas kaohsiungensis]KAF1704985.1 3-methylcrotonyl-CoA carboxylase [Pseudoxanthomonas kaohsiungensis]